MNDELAEERALADALAQELMEWIREATGEPVDLDALTEPEDTPALIRWRDRRRSTT